MRRVLKRSFNIIAAAVIAFAGLGGVSPAQAIGEACPTPFSAYDPVQYSQEGTGALVKAGDGAMWTKKNQGGNNPKIVRILDDGTRSEFTIPGSAGDIAAGPDGAIWFTSDSPGPLQLSRIANNGTITNTPVDANGLRLRNTILGPDGAFWGIGFVSNSAYLVRMATDGTSTRYAVPGAGLGLGKLAVASDGNIWFAAEEGKIGRFTLGNSTLTQFPWGKTGQSNFLRSFISGPDGALWYISYDSDSMLSTLGRMATDGTHSEFQNDSFVGAGEPSALIAGDDDNIWYIAGGGGVGRFSPTTHQVENFVARTLVDHPGIQSIGAATDTIWVSGVEHLYKLDLANLPVLATPKNFTTSGAVYTPDFSWQSVAGATSYEICRDGFISNTTTAANYSDQSATEEVHFFAVYAKDNAGHYSSPSFGVEMNVDRAAPVLGELSLTADPVLHGETSTLSVDATDAYGIYDVRFTVDGGEPQMMHLKCIGVGCSTPTDTYEIAFGWTGDADCGIACTPQFVPLEDGVHTIVVTARDGIGRPSIPKTISLTVGLVPPTSVMAVKTPTNSAPIINWTPLAGVDHYVIYRDGNATPIATSTSPTYTDTATLADGTHTYTVATADGNGNVSAQSSATTVVVDKSVPVASAPSVTPGLVLFTGTLSISASATDSLSGVVGGEYYIDTDPGQGNGVSMTYNASTGKITASRSVSNGAFSAGNHTVYIRTKDAAGNWSTPVSKTFFYL